MMPIMKKRFKTCGNKVMVAREPHGNTPPPEDCSLCRTIGIKKARAEVLNVKAKCRNTVFS